MVATADDLDIGRLVVRNGCYRDLSDDVVDAYRAPFPDERYMAAARTFPGLVPRRPTIPARNCSTKPESVWASGRNRRSSCSRRRIRSRPTTVIHSDTTSRLRPNSPISGSTRRPTSCRRTPARKSPSTSSTSSTGHRYPSEAHSDPRRSNSFGVRSASLVEERPEQRVPRPKDGAEQQQSVKLPSGGRERDRCPR